MTEREKDLQLDALEAELHEILEQARQIYLQIHLERCPVCRAEDNDDETIH
jgi:hypothetical protein